MDEETAYMYYQKCCTNKCQLHARLHDVGVTGQAADDTINTRIPICLDFDFKSTMLLNMEEEERELFLREHRVALAKLCMIAGHILWIRYRKGKPWTHMDSPFKYSNINFFMSDASGVTNCGHDEEAKYKLSAHVVIRSLHGCWCNLESSRSMAILLNQLLRDAFENSHRNDDLLKVKVYCLARALLPDGDAFVAPFDEQIYAGRSLRMMGCVTKGGGRPLIPCVMDAQLNFRHDKAGANDIDVIKAHDPWYTSKKERDGEIFNFEHLHANAMALEDSTLKKRVKCRKLCVPKPIAGGGTPAFQVHVDLVMNRMYLHILKEVGLSEMPRLHWPVSKLSEVSHPDKPRILGHMQIILNSTLCPWKFLRQTGETNMDRANHTSRCLLLEIKPETRTCAWEASKFPTVTLTCFSQQCAKRCGANKTNGEPALTAYSSVIAQDKCMLKDVAELLKH